MRLSNWLDDFTRHAGYGLRVLRRSPGFTAVAILSLGLGIGGNAAIFSLLYQVSLRSLPVVEPERLVALHSEANREGNSQSDNSMAVFSYPLYRRLRDSNTVFAGLIARAFGSVTAVTNDRVEQLGAETVSGNFFEVLGLRPALGRLFAGADDQTPGGHPVIVLSHGYWTRVFGASHSALNQPIRVNGLSMTIIGVAPPGFYGLISGQSPDIYLPIAMKVQATPGWDGSGNWKMHWVNLFGRLKPGFTVEQAGTAMAPVYRAAVEEEMAQMGNLPQRYQERMKRDQLLLHAAAQGVNQLRRQWESPLLAVVVMAGLVLLIACSNVAGLLIARASARQREIAIRYAIGARRWDVMRQLLTECLLLWMAGGALGMVLARWIGGGLLRLVPPDEFSGWLQPGIDVRVLAVSLGLSLITGVVFGLLPALAGSKPQTAAARSPLRLRRVLVAGQIALSLMLLIGAGLFARTFFNLMQHELGFRPERLFLFSLNPVLAGYKHPGALALHERLRSRLVRLPGVLSVAAGAMSPLGNAGMGAGITVEGYRPSEEENVTSGYNIVSPGFFRTLAIRVVAGREFAEADNEAAPKVAIVNERFVRRYLKGQNPLGRRMGFGGGKVKLDIEIVGVVADSTHSSLRDVPDSYFYRPMAQSSDPRMVFLLRTARHEEALPNQVRAIVSELNPLLPVTRMTWMETRIAERAFIERLIALLASAFGVTATLLAALGLYGVISYSVVQRTTEIGIRIAVGATRGDILGLMMKEAAVMMGVGLLAGMAAALVASQWMASQLFGVQPRDPLVFGIGAVALAITAMAAALAPALRASAIDPLRALQHE